MKQQPIKIEAAIPPDLTRKVDLIYALLKSLSLHLGGPEYGRKRTSKAKKGAKS